MALNQAQRIALRTTLRLLEERCNAMLVLLNADAHPHVMLQIAPDLSVETRQELRAQITQIRSAIARLAETYQLVPEPRSMRHGIEAILATSWADLEDTRPAKLRRYGAVDPALVAPLDASIEEFIARLTAMRLVGAADDAKGDPIEEPA